MPSWLLYTLGVVIFAFGLVASIALHEIGHMVPAKKFGVKVTQYMVGFGPTMFSRKRGDTEYGLKWIPLGGYIRMIGMVPPRADGSRSRWPRRMATAVEDFRQVSRSEVQPGDEHRQFYRLTPGKKMIVMVGGPTMNLLIYVVLTLIILMTIGVETQRPPTLTVNAGVKCVVPASKAATTDPNNCPASLQAPAFGKLTTGDTITAVNGTPVASWDQLVNRVQNSAGVPLSLTVERDDVQRTVSVTPVRNEKRVDDGKGGVKTIDAGYLGIEPVIPTYFRTLGVTEVPGEIGSQIKRGVSALVAYPEKIGNLFGTVFQGEKRDREGAVGVVGIGRISGDIAETDRITAKSKVVTLLGLLASVNLLLFFFNLLPLLPLDGGHVAGAIVESIKRGRARLRARRSPTVTGPDGVPVDRPRSPIFVDTASMLPVMYGVASILIVLTLLTLYADIVSPIDVFGG